MSREHSDGDCRRAVWTDRIATASSRHPGGPRSERCRRAGATLFGDNCAPARPHGHGGPVTPTLSRADSLGDDRRPSPRPSGRHQLGPLETRYSQMLAFVATRCSMRPASAGRWLRSQPFRRFDQRSDGVGAQYLPTLRRLPRRKRQGMIEIGAPDLTDAFWAMARFRSCPPIVFYGRQGTAHWEDACPMSIASFASTARPASGQLMSTIAPSHPKGRRWWIVARLSRVSPWCWERMRIS